MKFSNILKHNYIIYLFKIFTFKKISKFLNILHSINFFINYEEFFQFLCEFYINFSKVFKNLCRVNFYWMSPPRTEILATLLKILFDDFHPEPKSWLRHWIILNIICKYFLPNVNNPRLFYRNIRASIIMSFC